MSTHQVSKPRAAKKSIAENSARPGTCRSKVGCDAIEEPCTNRMVPRVCAGSPAYFCHRNSFTSLPLLVQCSSPRMAGLGVTGLFIVWLRLLCAAKDAAALGIDLDRDIGADLETLERMGLHPQHLTRRQRGGILADVAEQDVTGDFGAGARSRRSRAQADVLGADRHLDALARAGAVER